MLEAERDHFFTRQPDLLFNALTCPKRIVRFTAEEGAEEHCHMGNMSLFHQRVFDWLDETLPG